MANVPIVYVYGISDSGKTRLVERLLFKYMERGVLVGTIKMSKSEALDLDTEGKDTHRHARAGAVAIGASSLSDSALFVPRRLAVPDLVELIATVSDLGLVLVEGLGDDVPDNAPKIAVGEVKGLVPGTIMELPDAEGELGGLMMLLDRIRAKAVQQKVEEVEDMVRLRVDGRDIPLKTFVQDYLEGTVRGAVGALHDTGGPGDEIVLQIPRRHEG